MMTLIVTADDTLYARLTARCTDDGETYWRASDVLEGRKVVLAQPIERVIVDMSVHAADTFVEMLRSRASTGHIPVYAIESRGRLPFALRRLCTDILEADTL